MKSMSQRRPPLIFGNSLTGSTAPDLHTALGKWTWDAITLQPFGTQMRLVQNEIGK